MDRSSRAVSRSEVAGLVGLLNRGPVAAASDGVAPHAQLDQPPRGTPAPLQLPPFVKRALARAACLRRRPRGCPGSVEPVQQPAAVEVGFGSRRSRSRSFPRASGVSRRRFCWRCRSCCKGHRGVSSGTCAEPLADDQLVGDRAASAGRCRSRTRSRVASFSSASPGSGRPRRAARALARRTASMVCAQEPSMSSSRSRRPPAVSHRSSTSSLGRPTDVHTSRGIHAGAVATGRRQPVVRPGNPGRARP